MIKSASAATAGFVAAGLAAAGLASAGFSASRAAAELPAAHATTARPANSPAHNKYRRIPHLLCSFAARSGGLLDRPKKPRRPAMLRCKPEQPRFTNARTSDRRAATTNATRREPGDQNPRREPVSSLTCQASRKFQPGGVPTPSRSTYHNRVWLSKLLRRAFGNPPPS